MPKLRLDRWSLLIVVSISLLVAACTQIVPAAVPGPFRFGAVGAPASEDDSRVLTNPTVQTVQFQQTAVPTATPAVGVVAAVPDPTITLPTVAVKRGAITQTVQLNGRVSGTNETAVTFGSRMVPVSIDVK